MWRVFGRGVVAAAMMCGVVACKKTTPDATPQVEQPTTAADPKEGSAPVKAVPLTDAQRHQVMLALGCPEEAITGQGCAVCPEMATMYNASANGVEGEPYVPEGGIPVELFGGKYTTTGSAQQAIALIDGCVDLAGSMRSVLLVHIADVSQPETPHTLAYAALGDHIGCMTLDGPQGLTRMVCHYGGGRQGVSYEGYDWIDWITPQRVQGRLEAQQQGLINGNGISSCGENVELFTEITPGEPKDLDGDGLVDLPFSVNVSVGPSEVSSPDECFDGYAEEGEAARPERTEEKFHYDYEMLQTSDGFRERSGQPATVPVPAGLEDLF